MMAAAEIEAARAERRTAPIFRDFAEEFMRRQAQRWKPTTRRSNAAALRRHLLPAFGAGRVADIARIDVERGFDSMSSVPGTANRALPVLSVMMTQAERWGVRPQGSNPCRNMRRHRTKPGERFLSVDELKRLGSELDHADGRGGLCRLWAPSSRCSSSEREPAVPSAGPALATRPPANRQDFSFDRIEAGYARGRVLQIRSMLLPPVLLALRSTSAPRNNQ